VTKVEEASQVGLRTSGEIGSYWYQVVRVWYEVETPPTKALPPEIWTQFCGSERSRQ